MKAVTKETGVVAEAGDARTEIGAQPFSLLEYRVAISGTVSCPQATPIQAHGVACLLTT